MKKPSLTCLILLIFLLIGPTLAPASPPTEGEALLDISLPVPRHDQQRQYLGLEATDMFKIPKIKSEVVIIEIFSMY